MHRTAGVECGLQRERFEQAVVGQDAAHFLGALQIGFVLFEQFFNFFPARQRLLLLAEHGNSAVLGHMLFFDADQALGLLDIVERDTRHAKRIAPHIGRHIHARGPAVIERKQVFLRLQAKHCHRRKTLALIA